ncbi:transposase [Bradyrhizobium sp. ISRA442]|uniref:transposase n=1 Tax=Bradyrhizobium sp. ISRA442 TaxID=2866197 RepID=UPI00404A2076
MTISRAEVITSVERRRRWSQDEKERLVAASLEPGATASEVARMAGLHVSQLFRWRKELCKQGNTSMAPLVPVEIGPSVPPRDAAEAPLTTASARRRKTPGHHRDFKCLAFPCHTNEPLDKGRGRPFPLGAIIVPPPRRRDLDNLDVRNRDYGGSHIGRLAGASVNLSEAPPVSARIRSTGNSVRGRGLGRTFPQHNLRLMTISTHEHM